MRKPKINTSIGAFFISVSDFIGGIFRKSSLPNSLCTDPLREFTDNLSHISWDMPDVMVGTVRNEEQLEYNLNQKRYYVPAKFLSEKQLPIRYIALYEWDEEDNACICRMARVLSTETIPRGSIPVTMRPEADPTEPYYSFTVDPWTALPHEIRIRDTVRGRPLFTNRFLIEHCKVSWELFAIGSEKEYRLWAAICKLLDEDKPSSPAYAIGEKRKLTLEKDCLILRTKRGRILEKISVQQYKDSPRLSFLQLKKHLKA